MWTTVLNLENITIPSSILYSLVQNVYIILYVLELPWLPYASIRLRTLVRLFHYSHVMSIRRQTLREIAIDLSREKILSNRNNESTERTLLVIGSKISGKTNIINQLIEKEKGPTHPSSTYLLEYQYGRQSGCGMIKDVCHIWELGSGTTFSSLVSVIVNGYRSLTVVLVLDLTKPERILNTTETLLDRIRSLVIETNKECKNCPDIEQEDVAHLDVFPVPLVIVGGKYDIFQNTEPAKKRIVCQYVRCLSHILQADLLFYSNNDNKLVKNVREVLLSYAFGFPINRNVVVTDHSKPLRVPAGCDSFRNIHGASAMSVNFSLDVYKNSLTAHLSQEVTKEDQLPDDPATDANFREPVIDNLCQQKNEDLKRNVEESRRRMFAVQLL